MFISYSKHVFWGGVKFVFYKTNRCLEELIKRDAPGYAIGGLAGGEDK